MTTILHTRCVYPDCECTQPEPPTFNSKGQPSNCPSPKKIRTNFDYPPIPIRSMDWSAWYDGEEDERMDIGHGPTEEKAIEELVQNYPR